MSAARWAALGVALAIPAAAGAQEPAGVTLDEVVRAALESSAALRSAHTELRIREGLRREAGGAFDPQVSAQVTAEQERADDAVEARALRYDLGVERRLRSGIRLSPHLVFDRTGETAYSNAATARMDVVVPLLRGRGGGPQRAAERAAGLEVAAAGADVRHRRAEVARDAVEAFWRYRSADERLRVLREAEARALRLAGETRTLIRADLRPAADSIPVLANAASKRAARIAGEQALDAARRVLGLAMGATPQRVAALPAPATPFPEPTVGTPAAPDAAAVALRSRPELDAARGRSDAAVEGVRGLRGESLSQLDVRLGVGYTGMAAGSEALRLVSPFVSPEGGPQAIVQLSYALPVGNGDAAGRRIRGEAEAQRARIRLDELARTVSIEAAAAADALRRSAEEVGVSAEAVRLHSAAVEGEKQKYRMGTSTLVDVILAEDGLTSATLGGIDARLRHAVSLADLHFQMGYMGAGDAVDADALTRWPAR